MFSWECVESVWCCRPHHYFHPLLLCCCIPLLRYQGRSLQPTYSRRGTISLHSPQGVLCFLFSHDCLYNSPLCQKSSIKVTRIVFSMSVPSFLGTTRLKKSMISSYPIQTFIKWMWRRTIQKAPSQIQYQTLFWPNLQREVKTISN